MNSGTAATSITRHTSDADEIRALLEAHHLPIRSMQPHARGMITAVQPLSMGSTEICTDSILVERILYPTRDILTRETETLTLKKAAFSDFEPSLTPIPKYCFVSPDTPACVLVHSVPRCTLEAVLNWCEQQYPHPYPCDHLRYYTDWLRTAVKRLRDFAPEGRFRLPKKILHLPKAFILPPPHIARKQRERFAAFLLHTVLQHHGKSVFHDCITEKTVFFTGPYQPLFLANYAGVPSAVLEEHLPPELLEDSAKERFGPQFRDTYSLALFCYRILTGEHHDGRLFLLQSPRPTIDILREIAQVNELSLSFRSVSRAKHTMISLFATVRDIFGTMSRMFSPDTFPAWRKLNRATGCLWRQMPLFGTFCDIYSPTMIAQALRYVLDRHWVAVYHAPKGASHQSTVHGPDLALLLSVFRVRHTVTYPQIAEAFTALSKQNDEKRSAFGYVMDLPSSPAGWFKPIFRPKFLLPGSIAAVILLLSLFFVYSINRKSPEDTVPPAAVTANVQQSQDRRNTPSSPAIAPEAPSAENTGSSRITPTVEPSVATVPSVQTAESIPASRQSTPKDTVKAVRPSSRPSSRPRKVAGKPASPPPPGILNPALGFKDVFVVIGVRDSCNPGELAFATGGKTIPLGKTTPPRLKLYMVRRTTRGFSAIREIWLCRAKQCDQTLYYRGSPNGGSGRAVYTRIGDAISGNRSELERFVQLRLSLIKK
ncbi:MAG: hypothetical protein JW863_07580 [Chitinispirillaceae bacterium]|nr:hypothetical protein [Chitinispirillaceae bacterium]